LIGRQCLLCGFPVLGRGLDVNPVFSRTLKPGDVVLPPDFIIRDDCGNHSLDLDPETGEFTGAIMSTNLIKFNQTTDPTIFPGYTDADCETNSQKICADGMAARNYFFQTKAISVPHGYEYDFRYCKDNGWLSMEAKTASAAGYDATANFTRHFCAERAKEFDFDSISTNDFKASFFATHLSESGLPTPEQSRWISAWVCVTGGAGCDAVHCHYTYGDLGQPTAIGEDMLDFCTYYECEGWDPIKGMPLTPLAKASGKSLPPDDGSLTAMSRSRRARFRS